MAMRWGPGPVFVFECLTAARRRQHYVLRAVLVLALLAVIAVAWAPIGAAFQSRAEMAALAQRFFVAVVVVQMTGVLLAAPAATAGAVCVDKGRGTLLHVFATDLSGREIVLGKLAARLVPVLALIFSGLPVLALSGLLGGVDPRAMLGAYLASVGVALVGCAVALLLSVWAKKTHHALLPAYAILGVWAAAYPVLLTVAPRMMPAPMWSLGDRIGFISNPFLVAFSPYVLPDEFGLADQAAFLAASALLALLLVSLAAARIRPVALGQASRPARKRPPGLAARVVKLVPGPALDDDPVLWREWHRKLPSHWTGRFWTAYAVASGVASAAVIVLYFLSPLQGVHVIAAQVNAWQIAVGLLLLSVSAASALAEERDRGSLDVIMTTPLATRSIVLAKWWGTFALVPRLMIFPVWVTCALALLSDRWTGAFWMIVLTLAYAACITSLGLALGTWVRHPGRAIGTAVLAYVLASAAWPMVVEGALVLLGRGMRFATDERFAQQLMLGSPYFGVRLTTEHAGRFGEGGQSGSTWAWWANWLSTDPCWPLAWVAIYGLGAAVLLQLTLLTFDRCLGRATFPRWRVDAAWPPPDLGRPQPALAPAGVAPVLCDGGDAGR